MPEENLEIYKSPYKSNTIDFLLEATAVYCLTCAKYMGTVSQLDDYIIPICPHCGAFGANVY